MASSGVNTSADIKLVVISGCSGGGKSTLIVELNKRGYTTVPEAGRELVKEQMALGSGILPWEKPDEFCALLIEKSVAAYHLAKRTLLVYPEYGYKIVELPKISVSERIDFLLSSIHVLPEQSMNIKLSK